MSLNQQVTHRLQRDTVRCFAALLLACGICLPSAAEDWPTEQHNNRRTALTEQALDAAALDEAWSHQTAQPPQPAWAGPAARDAYRSKTSQPSRRSYDLALNAIVVGDSLYFGSSADDAVHCLDTKTGKERWRFTTDGPVRLAPTHWQGRLYFGSDDGYAYAIDAERGELVWKFSPTAGRPLILNNSRLVSSWPCRTGVLVEDGIAYFGASMLPWRESYFCAVNAETGKASGPGCYVAKQENQTLEGTMAATQTRIIVPQGRSSPLMIDRRSGKSLGGFGATGSFVLVTPDDQVVQGPRSGFGLARTRSEDRTSVAFYEHGNRMLMRGGRAFLLTDHWLAAIDHAADSAKKPIWRIDAQHPFSMIAASDTIFLGGTDEVAAVHAEDGRSLWKHAVHGRAHGLVAADDALFVSTDEGTIHCFRPSADKPAGDAKHVDEQPEDEKPQPAKSEDEPRLTLAAGPYIEFPTLATAVVRWETSQPTPTILEYELAGPPQRIADSKLKTQHEVTIPDLRRHRTYTCRIEAVVDGRPIASEPFACDTFFNYQAPDLSAQPSPYADDNAAKTYATTAQHILDKTGIDRGVCLVLGFGEGRLGYELARRSNLRVIGVETDAARVAAARRRLQSADVYGTRLSVLHVDDLAKLPFPRRFANLIVSDRLLQSGDRVGDLAEMHRRLRPGGGVIILGQPAGASGLAAADLDAWLDEAQLVGDVQSDGNGAWMKITRDPLPGAGEWSHQYGRADNATFGGETLGGARTSTDFEVQWVGRPGPRYQADRQGRKPAPLSTGGRMFAQGLNRIVALDAYNGAVLWSAEIPPMQRMNVPRDCSNWCADDEHVFVAVGNRCWRFDAQTGRLGEQFDVTPGLQKDWQYDWGYIARAGDKLVGSAIKQGSAFTDYWGMATGGWYDAFNGQATAKVCSENLFALDKADGRQAWVYRGAVIVNSSIAISGNRVCFVECRDPDIQKLPIRRISSWRLWRNQYLVALDLDTGTKLWETPLKTSEGTTMFNVAAGQDRIVIVSSGDGRYGIYAFDASSGKPAWQETVGWMSNNHGGHMARPAIVGSRLYVRPAVFDLATGKRQSVQVPYGSCGTYACSADALIFRSGNVTLWSPESEQFTSWNRLRPSCWLSTIPAAGMLLSPEGGGGCSCAGWLETSIAFMPKRFPPPTFRSHLRTFVDRIQVELLQTVAGGETRYTLDGSEPSQDSLVYAEPITVTRDAMIRAKTFWRPQSEGPVTESELLSGRFQPSFPDPQFSTGANSFVDAIDVGFVSATKVGRTHYTLDGSEPTVDSPVYETPIHITSDTTIKAKTFWPANGPDEARESKLLSREFKRNYPNPSVLPLTDYFVDSVAVEADKHGEEGVLRYTLDGSEPSEESPVYDAPLTIADETTLKAKTFWPAADAGQGRASATVVRSFKPVAPQLVRDCKINFQKYTQANDQDYLFDVGLPYGAHATGHVYGWNRDMRHLSCQRGRSKDFIRDTFMHFQPGAAWEIAVEDGQYEVTVCVGDSHYGSVDATIDVEGVEFCNRLELPAQKFREVRKVVDVRDGRITITSHDRGGLPVATRMNFVEIRKK